MTLNDKQKQWIEKAAPAAKAAEGMTGFPSLLVLGLATISSTWGEYLPENNPLAIRAYPNCFGVQKLYSYEFQVGTNKRVLQEFATFPDLQSAFEKFGFLTLQSPLYSRAHLGWLADARHDLIPYARNIARVYAANDPLFGERFAQMVKDLSELPEVVGEAKEAKGEEAAAELDPIDMVVKQEGHKLTMPNTDLPEGDKMKYTVGDPEMKPGTPSEHELQNQAPETALTDQRPQVANPV